ncbi:pyridoxamine 5'-phosphate oxidase family protein [Streptomyces sp. B6B3]|uniref:helix-turn-helix domain-containing protein n=1 Tax=Streptomyces sp. B6B3 TaxID=3153570 RepID=UPI00325D733F
MAGAPSGSNHRSDVGRRVALRRERLGLTREDVARQAGIAPEYLRYLETHAASPSIGSLTRVARALQTTVARLSGVEESAEGADAEAPLRRRAQPTELGPAECRELLAAHRVGRVAVATPEGPTIVPVSYRYLDDAVVFRAEPGTAPPIADGEDVAFEVDQLDETQRVGWSVMAVGRAREVTDRDTISRLAARDREEPWPGDDLARWVRVEAERLAGRRVPLG